MNNDKDGDYHYTLMYGDVTLTAEFGNGNELGNIRGVINNMKLDLFDRIGSEDIPELHEYPGMLNLERTVIGSSQSGFFQGRVTGSAGARTYTGNDGGQFHGNGEVGDHPGRVGGTFGAKSNDGKTNSIGAFAADKEDE